MISKETTQGILNIARETIQALAENFPVLRQESPEALSERVLSLDESATGYLLTVAADGMDLSEKASLERQMREDFAQKLGSDRPVALNFKRLQKAPKPMTSLGAPFGLNLQRRAIPGVKHVIVVASGKGGVGKSTVSTNLAVSLSQQGHKVGLLDADIYGPSAPTLLGVSGPLEVNAERQIIPVLAHGIKTLSFGFLSDAYHPVIWRGPMVSKALKQLCYDATWGELDFLVVDLPPGTGDVQLTLIEQLPLHGAIIVTTPQDVALIDAHKALSMFEKLEIPVLGVIENMAQYSCPNCGHTSHIFGGIDEETGAVLGAVKFAKDRGISFLGSLPLLAGIRQKSDAGTPPALERESAAGKPFSELANAVVKMFRV